MSYDSITVVVIKDGIELPNIKTLQEAHSTIAGPGYIYFKWNWEDWWEIGREVDDWLNRLPNEDYLFLRDGEEDGDYEVRGTFYDPDIHIGIIIPELLSLKEPQSEEPERKDYILSYSFKEYLWSWYYVFANIGIGYTILDIVGVIP